MEQKPIFLSAPNMPVREGAELQALGVTSLPSNPFVGLRPFEPTEEMLFFGRRAQIKELLAIFHKSRFMAVVGSSGCGKSSLIRAGLIPNLEAGFIAGRRDLWNVATMKPGDAPLRNLAVSVLSAFTPEPEPEEVARFTETIRQRGLTALTDYLKTTPRAVDTNLLLLVDQFEEIFRFGSYDEEEVDPTPEAIDNLEGRRGEASDFVSIMLELARQQDFPVYVVMTMRSDFLGDCDAFYGLPEAMNKSQYLVPRLTTQQRQEAIESPIRFYGAAIDARLTDRILNDMGDALDQLPIMQHALMRTWERWQQRPDGSVDLPDYEAIGTMESALWRDAESVLKLMSQKEHQITKLMFQALTETDAKGRRLRRPARLSEIVLITGAQRDAVLNVIGRFQSENRSFLTLSGENDPIVDISHESLIRQWETLRNWVDEEVKSRELYLRLAGDAVRYYQEKREAALWRDPGLQLALDWQARRQPNITWARRYQPDFVLAEKFLKESEQLRADEQTKAENQRKAELESARALAEQREIYNRRLKLAIVALAVMLLLAAGTAVYALDAGRRAAKSAAEAKENEKIAINARDALEKQSGILRQQQADLKTANAGLETEKKNALAEKARAEEEKTKADAAKANAQDAQAQAERASADAKNQAAIANAEKIKAVGALNKAEQTAAADKLQRQAHNKQNAAEIDEALEIYKQAAQKYDEIKDPEGVAYIYADLGQMLIGQPMNKKTTREFRGGPEREVDTNKNWVTNVLLNKSVPPRYFRMLGLSESQIEGLRYYAISISTYHEYGRTKNLNAFNGSAAALDKIGDFMSDEEFPSPDDDAQADAATSERDRAVNDAFCFALEDYRKANNYKGQIEMLEKIASGLVRDETVEEETSTKSPKGSGCRGMGGDAADYYEKAIDLYPRLIERYSGKTSQVESGRKNFAALLIKVGSFYLTSGDFFDDQSSEMARFRDLAIKKFNAAADVYRKINDIDTTVATLTAIAEGIKNKELRLKYYELAVNEYHVAGKYKEEADLLVSIGRRYRTRARPRPTMPILPSAESDYLKGIDFLKQALLVYQQLGLAEDEYKSWDILGGSYYELKRYDESLANYRSALKIAVSAGNKEREGHVYYRIGVSQEKKGLRDEARVAFESALRLLPEPHFERNIAQSALRRLNAPPSPTPFVNPFASPSPTSAPSSNPTRTLSPTPTPTPGNLQAQRGDSKSPTQSWIDQAAFWVWRVAIL